MNNILNGYFVSNIWRDEKTAKSGFLFRTKKTLMSCMYQTKQVVRNKQTDKDDVWYTVVCDASNTNTPSYAKGTPLSLTGEWNTETDTWKFIITDINIFSEDESVTIKFLSGGEFPLFTEEAATKCVKEISCNIDILFNDLALLSKISEIAIRDLQSYKEKLEDIDMEKKVFDYMSSANIPYPYAAKCVKLFGTKALSLLKLNPYKVGEKIGLTFKQCEYLFYLQGGCPIDSWRLKMAANDLIDMYANQGHIYTPLEQFKKGIERKLNNEFFQTKIPFLNIISMLKSDFCIEKIDGCMSIYSKRLFEAEKRVARNIKRLANQSVNYHYTDNLIPYAENQCGIKYGEQQKRSFPIVLQQGGVKIITGGPGTGKTTTIKGILLAYKQMFPNSVIKLAAPTGRAAQRMAESTGMEATTIHRLLDYKPYGNSVTYKDANNPIQADLVVIDEMSMTDIILFDMLLEAIKTGTTLLLVGDIHQLQSVGAGAVLNDLLKSKDTLIQKSMLTEVYRQKEGSPVIDNSQKINNGDVSLEVCDDFQIINTKSEEECFEQVKNIYSKYYNKEKPFDTQILCPSRQGICGVNNLNIMLKDISNNNEKSIKYGKVTYKIGDKVIFTRNNPLVEYYNGDIGIIVDITSATIVVDVKNHQITITRELFDDLDLAYAMTIHKSQGSEFKNIILVLPSEPKNMLVRNLFYTGLTRSKKRVFIVSQGTALKTAIKVTAPKRRTLLSRLLPVC